MQSDLVVATLNFSGINTNPFEYDDGSEFFQKLNQTVANLIKQKMPDFKQWSIGKIDKDYLKDRLSVGYSYKLDSVNGKLLTQQQFEDIWKIKFNNSGIKAEQTHIDNCMMMDLIFYRALAQVFLSLNSDQQFQQSIPTSCSKWFNSFLEIKFNRPASKLDVKKSMITNYLFNKKIDILLLQEAGCVEWVDSWLQNYIVHKNHDSVIICKKEIFGEPHKERMNEHGKDLDINGDTSFLFTTNNYLIISGHLKSKQAIAKQQAQALFKKLKQLKNIFPNLIIIVGMDANHFVQRKHLLGQEQRQGQKNIPLFSMVPETKNKPTTIKKRSYLQAQFSKAGKQVSQVKDFIVSNKEIKQFSIQTIAGIESKNQLLPNDIHPYDHFVVLAVISI